MEESKDTAEDQNSSQETTPASSTTLSINISYKSGSLIMTISSSTTLHKLKEDLQDRTGILVDNQKLILKGRTLSNPDLVLGTLVAPSSSSSSAAAASLKLVLVGTPSEELKKVEEVISSIRVRVIDDLNVGTSSRGNKGGGMVTRSRHGFQAIEVLPSLPNQDKARALLEELATDPGVLHVMQKYGWTVGALCELYPEGYVGVSDICVMGLNQNKGQKILLRLRTDDLQGFRKVLSIRKVLYHELSHNVHSDHNDDFYVLMRQIECDVVQFNSGGRSLGGAYMPGTGGGGAIGGGAFLGGAGRLGGANSDLSHVLSAREMAGLAAVQRLTEEEKKIEKGCGCGHGRGPDAEVHARPHSPTSPIVPLGQQEREVSLLPPPPASSPVLEEGGREGVEAEVDHLHLMEEGDEAVEGATSTQSAPSRETPEQLVEAEVLKEMEIDVIQKEQYKPPSPSPPPPPLDTNVQPASPVPPSPPSNPNVEQLVAMGFAADEATKALKVFGGDVMRAADHLLSHDGQAPSPLEGGEGGGGSAGLGGREGKALESIRRLAKEAGDPQSKEAAFTTLLTMVQTILDNPTVEKFKKVRLSNAKFHRNVGRHASAIDFLSALGFERRQDEGQEEILELKRNDSGLLWLGKSALEQQAM